MLQIINGSRENAFTYLQMETTRDKILAKEIRKEVAKGNIIAGAFKEVIFYIKHINTATS